MPLRSTIERYLPLAALAAGSAALPTALYCVLGSRMVMVPMHVHFVVAVGAGFGALAAALALTCVGARRGDARAVHVGTAFSVMAALLFLHGLATPSVLIGSNGLVQLAGVGNVPAGAFVLALAALPALRRPQSVRPLLSLQLTLLAAIVLIGAVGLLRPGAIPVLPRPGSRLASTVLVATFGLLAILLQRAVRTFTLTRRVGDLAAGVGVVLLGCAVAGLLLFGYMDVGFWLAHAFECLGLLLVGLPAALDLRHSAQSHALVGDLSAARLVAEEEAFVGPRVRALMVRLAEKDGYTELHTRRVSLLAVLVGERLGLAPARLRTLAVGGLLHDIGKLSVPDAILKKPGPLDDDEFAAIRRHPGAGHDLVVELGGFSDGVRRLVRDHHERLDGAGYPGGRGADQLDLETRILTVCDVYDALISKRVYRDAWPLERALALLREESGSAFDPACVVALEAVVTAAPERVTALQPAPVLRIAAA